MSDPPGTHDFVSLPKLSHTQLGVSEWRAAFFFSVATSDSHPISCQIQMNPEGFDTQIFIPPNPDVNDILKVRNLMEAVMDLTLNPRLCSSHSLSLHLPFYHTQTLFIKYSVCICDRSPRQHGSLNWLSNQIAFKDVDTAQKQQLPDWGNWAVTIVPNKKWWCRWAKAKTNNLKKATLAKASIIWL